LYIKYIENFDTRSSVGDIYDDQHDQMTVLRILDRSYN